MSFTSSCRNFDAFPVRRRHRRSTALSMRPDFLQGRPGACTEDCMGIDLCEGAIGLRALSLIVIRPGVYGLTDPSAPVAAATHAIQGMKRHDSNGVTLLRVGQARTETSIASASPVWHSQRRGRLLHRNRHRTDRLVLAVTRHVRFHCEIPLIALRFCGASCLRTSAAGSGRYITEQRPIGRCHFA